MRYECDEPGFEGCFIELSDAWKRREIREFTQWTKPEENARWLGLVASKIVDLRLDRIGMEPILDAAQMTQAALEEMDNRLYVWLSNAVILAVTEVQTLGESTGRRLWPTVGGKIADRPTPS